MGVDMLECPIISKRRFMEHKSPKNVTNKTTVLSKSFRKYGVNNFMFEILEEVEDINLLPEKEIYWIEKNKARVQYEFWWSWK